MFRGKTSPAAGLVALALFFAATGLAWGEENPRIAVLDFKRLGVDEIEGVFLVDKLRSDLVQTEKYTVLDRGQSEQIVEELGRQQSGLTDEKTAIQIGKQFNVQRIVTGRVAAQKSLGLVQVNAEMIDMKTGVILLSETITHEGDMRGFILEKVPSLAARLAGLGEKENAPPAPVTAAAVAPSTAAPPAAPAGKIKVALFPALFRGPGASRLEPGHEGVLRGMNRVFSLAERNFALAHSYYPLQQADDGQTLRKEFGEMERAWNGAGKPNERFVFRVARRFGVDAVLMYTNTAGGGNPPSFEVFLLDVASGKTYQENGTWQSGLRGDRGKNIARAAGRAMRAFWAASR